MKRRSMSSGEVVFILAFIVLPTAVLVSSVWAILFVRRQPDRIIERRYTDASSESTTTDDELEVINDTLVLPTVIRPEIIQSSALADEDREPVNREDSYEDDETAEEQAESEGVVEDIPYDETADDEDATSDSTSELEQQDEPEILQSTDDLNAVMAEVAANDTQAAQTPPSSEEDEDTQIYETSDLPVLERPEEQTYEDEAEFEPHHAPDNREEPVEEHQEAATESRWRRRKRPAPLRPSDPDASRARGRGRDPQRQVPQLGRSSRRRDGSSPDTPPNEDMDPDEPT